MPKEQGASNKFTQCNLTQGGSLEYKPNQVFRKILGLGDRATPFPL